MAQLINKKFRFSRGQLIIEILLAFGLSSLLIPALFSGFISGRSGKVQEIQRSEALGYLKEAEETTRSVREASWNSFAVNGTFHPVNQGSAWAFAAGDEVINGFTRSIVIADAYRDSGGKIILIGGTNDPSTKKVTLSVSWGALPTQLVSNSFYLTRFLGNVTWTQTTKADFDTGTKTGVTTTAVSDGEVQLAAGGKADWCEPTLTIAAVDLPKNGVANAVTAIEGQVFAGTGDNSSGISFANVAISNTDPPAGTITATFDGYKTNGVFGESGYAYLATDNNSKEIEIIDLNSIVGGKFQEAGSFNAPGNGNANSVYVTSSYGYMTGSIGNKLYNFKRVGSVSPTDADGVTLDGVGNRAVVIGNYAYVAINGTTNQLDIVDISSPTNLVKTKSFSVDGLQAKDIFVNASGTRAYLVTANSASQKEFFIIDVTDKSNPSVLGSYDTSGMSPKGVTVVTGNKAVVVGTGGTQQYQAIDITDETNPVHCTSNGRSGGLAIATGVNGVSSVVESDGDAYSYIITGDSSTELKIIEGGPGGKYASSGTFESSTFDAGHEVSFNRFITSFVKPSNTDIQFQVASVDASGGSCNGVSFDFVGPDLTAGTYFATSSAIPVDNNGSGYENPGRCFRYKVFLSATDLFASPVFQDMTINYSP